MKRYGNLWQQVCSLENIMLAHQRARRGKKHYTEVKMVDADPIRYCQEIRKLLVNKTFRNSEYVILFKREPPKEREIWKLPYFPDRIIHHCLVNVLEPIWMKTYIRDTYAAMPGRGIHDGVKRVRQALRDEPGTRYCLKMDVRKFYQSINHEVLRRVVRKKIKDREVLWLLDAIIQSAPGVPIGNYTSQHFGNLLLSELDHWIKETLKARHYFRYCDDLVILGPDKARLHEWRQRIAKYLAGLKLEMKGNWQVFPVSARGLDFLGYRFFHGYTLVRKSIVSRFKRRFLSGHNHRSMASYNGWLLWANTHNLRQKYNGEKRYENRLQQCPA